MAKTKRKRRTAIAAPLLQIGAKRDSVAVLKTLDAALQQALLLGRDVAAQELAREIGKLGGVNNVSVTNSTFNG